jgi:polygalacturonase
VSPLSRRALLLHSAVALAAPGLAVRGLAAAPRSPAAGLAGPAFDVRKAGARGDGRTRDTSAIQAAVEAAARTRGRVYFPPGEYLSGTVRLRSDVTLHLDEEAVLIASRDDGDFDPVERLAHEAHADAETTDFRFALLQGQGVERIRILGPGRIDGNRSSREGPKPIALKSCRQIDIHDVTIANAGNYAISLLGCDQAEIARVTIVNGYADGIDPDCCQNVRIVNCHVETRDDAIALKASFALGVRRATRNVTVRGCHLSTYHNAFKLGTESTGDFHDVSFLDCTVVGRPHPWKGELSSGIALTTVDGGRLQRVTIANVRMRDVRCPIFVRLGQRGWGQDVPAAGRLERVTISGVSASGALLAAAITGLAGRPISDVTIQNVRVSAAGGGSAEAAARSVPELEKTYPDAYMFRDLPAYGLYCRHVEGLTLDRIDLSTAQPDARPALILDDVRRARVRATGATPPTGDGPLIWLRSVRDCTLEDLRPRAGTGTLLRLTGAETAGIRLVGTDLSRVGTRVTAGTEVARTALQLPR